MKNIRLMIGLAFALFISAHIVHGQAPKAQNKKYVPTVLRTNKEMTKVKKDIANAFLNAEIYDVKNKTSDHAKKILVRDDRIEITFKKQGATLLYADIAEHDIVSQQYHKITPDGNGYTRFSSALELSNYSFIFKGAFDCDDLADDIFFLVRPNIEKRDSLQLEVFKKLAVQYRSLKVKPTVSEEQRKYIVQANMFNQEKAFSKAIDLYIKVIELDQTAYPAAYSNLALLSAQTYKYSAAIKYMKKYLLLEPEASDARSAQDKIYEWEAKK